jgi:hypothetical protein
VSRANRCRLLPWGIPTSMGYPETFSICPTPIGQGGRLVWPSLFWPLLQTFVSSLVKGASWT